MEKKPVFHLFGVEQQRPLSMAGEEGIEGRGVFAVLGVSRMRDEVGEGQDDVAEVQNT